MFTVLLLSGAVYNVIAQQAYFEDFETDNGNFTTFGEGSWEHGATTGSGSPGNALSGTQLWGTNLSGDYSDEESSQLLSPAIDLSAWSGSGESFLFSWWEYIDTEVDADFIQVEISDNGGGSWTAVSSPRSGDLTALGWKRQEVLLDPSLAVSGFRIRFSFQSDLSITADGYFLDDILVQVINPALAYHEDFEADDGEFSVTSNSKNSSWEWAAPSGPLGPDGAHSGNLAWSTNASGNYNSLETSYLESPEYDFSDHTGSLIIVSWWQFIRTETDFDFFSVEASRDGGASWDLAYGPVSGPLTSDWIRQTVELGTRYAVSNLRLRFILKSDASLTDAGVFIDDIILLAADLPNKGPTARNNSYNGLVFNFIFGNVISDNTGEGIDQDPEDHKLSLNPTPIIETSNGKLTLFPNGNFSYLPNGDYVGTDSFNYEIFDIHGEAAQATVSLSVIPGTSLRISRVGNDIKLEYIPIQETNHFVQYTNKFSLSAEWIDFPNGPHNDGLFVDALATSNTRRFYRLRTEPIVP